MHHAARHEGAFKLFAQRGNDLARRACRRHHKSQRPHDAFGDLVGQPEGAVFHAVDAVEVKVQVRQRTAFAGDMDEVVGAAQQLEVLCVVQHQHVGQWRRLCDMATGDDMTFTVGVLFARDAQRAQRAPGLACRGAAAGHLAGFGAAVDFDQQALQCRLGARRQLRRQRCGGRQRERHRGQRQPGLHQRFQVERRAHQRTRRGHTLQRAGDVGGVERPARVEGRAAQQRQQHGGLEAVAVLRRHGGHERDAGQRGPLQEFRQPLCLGADVGHQSTPAFGVRLRCAGGAAGQQAYGFQVGCDLGHHAGRPGKRRPAHLEYGPAARSGRCVVDQQIGRTALRRQLAQRLGQRVGRHQARLPAQQRGRQAEREVVAVLAQIDGAAGGQVARDGLRFGDEERCRYRAAFAPDQRLRQVACTQQGQRSSQGTALLSTRPDC